MKYKLIAVDLDGTLLSSKRTISDANMAAINKLKAIGVTIVINTGCTFKEIPECVRSCMPADYFICSNGTMIYDKNGGVLYKNCIPDTAFIKAFDTLCEYSTNMNIHDHGRTTIDADKATVECWLEYNASLYSANSFLNYCDRVNDFYNYYHDNLDIEQICCYFKYKQEKAECLERLKKISGIQTAASAEYNIEVFNAEVSKGKGIVQVCNMVGCDISEVIVSGDSLNDLPMFVVGAHGIAVANAMDELKAAADEIGCACEEHIMDYIFNKYYL